jgi:hypothetical protein
MSSQLSGGNAFSSQLFLFPEINSIERNRQKLKPLRERDLGEFENGRQKMIPFFHF